MLLRVACLLYVRADASASGAACCGAGAAEGDGDWAGKHPWRPWDRDKDLEKAASKPKAPTDLLKAAGTLSSRFSSGR